jgi:isopenicillin N synthase-like dioxygenase
VTSIPEINIESAVAGNYAQRLRKGKEIDAVCREVGFFTLRGHGVDQDLIDRLRQMSYSFFNLPISEKSKVALSGDVPRGYRGVGFEALSAGNAQQTPPDLKEYFHFGRQSWPNDTYYTAGDGPKYFIPNIWPTSPVGWAEMAQRYYTEMEQLAKKLLQLSALGLGLPEHFFDTKIDRHITAMRINHYPAQGDTPLPGQLRAGSHTDYGLLTILSGEDKPGGLEVLTRQGDWVSVQTTLDTFVVNIGDLLMRWTNDRWVSNTHRVVNPANTSAKSARLSIAFFHHPNYDTLIECLDADEPAKYPPVRSGQYRAEKYIQTRV